MNRRGFLSRSVGAAAGLAFAPTAAALMPSEPTGNDVFSDSECAKPGTYGLVLGDTCLEKRWIPYDGDWQMKPFKVWVEE